MQTILGKYEIRATIATGPMSTMYEGWDTAIDRRVAIKAVPLAQTVQTEGWQHLTRFRREAQAAGRLQHPAVVGIFDYGENTEFAFIVMEFVDGGSLKSVLEEGKRFSIAVIDRLMQDILAGLQYSHEQGVIHRDIKPANIMLTRDGHAKIADFGIARIEHSDITQIGMVMGTPAYMSPEQFRGEVTSASTDIYSAGVILYQLLTGERPFDGGLATIMHKALATEPPKPSDISGTVPHSADAVVARAMAKRPDQRFRDAREFAQALHNALSAKPTKPATRMMGTARARMPFGHALASANEAMPSRKYLASKMQLAAGAALVMLAAAGGTVAYRMSTSHAALKPDEKSTQSARSSPERLTGQTGVVATPAVANTAKPEPPPQTVSVDPTFTQPAATYQLLPAQPPIPSISPPPPPLPEALPHVLAPTLPTLSTPQYSLPLGVPSPLPKVPKPPQTVRKSTPAPPRSVLRQGTEPGTDTAGPPQAATPPAQANNGQTERRSRDPVVPQEAPKMAERDTTTVSPPVAPQEKTAPLPTFGTYGYVNGRRVFIPPAN